MRRESDLHSPREDEDGPVANPERRQVHSGDPTEQDWREVGDEVRHAAEQAGRKPEQPETD
ncbi:hypothetical protein OG738_03920 [Amycolatopsis sp. NBC_01488]|uniref:hypothetical protein n=1 Tax=Amycolatopsis sp. NBC_01488 TaxID=2903563 RepID=UPI002E27F803|nr:hypothetical protein [Amycolatopsis sp. NBC_01488]